MLRNYLITAFRNLTRYRVFSLINIAGLAIGIAAFFFINTYVHYELSYDRDMEDAENIYRVLYSRVSESGEKVEFASASPMVGPEFEDNFPEITAYGRAFKYEGVVSVEDKTFNEENMFWAEPMFTRLMGFEFSEQEDDSILARPYTAVLSETTARQLFGEGPYLGKSFDLNGKNSFKVVGVYRDLPPNKHFKADVLLSYINWERLLGEQAKTYGWVYSGFYTYVKLQPGTDYKALNEKIAVFLQGRLGEFMKAYKLQINYQLQPLTDIHLNSHFMHELGANGNRNSIVFLNIIAWFIIVIAWINFINLLSVGLIKRWHEISLRKVMGAGVRQLISQFLLESFLVNLISLLFAVTLFEVLYPAFSHLTGVPSGIFVWGEAWFIKGLLIVILAGTMLAGLVPVWGILSRKLAANLKNTFTGSKSAVRLRKALLVFQFFMALVLFAGTIAVYMQIQYLHESETGNDKTGIIILRTPRVGGEDLVSRRESFKSELEKMPSIKGISYSSVIPGKNNMLNRGGIFRKGQDPVEGKNYRITDTDYDYVDVYSNILIEGRNFSREYPSDKDAVIVNMTAARQLGFESPEETVGKKIYIRYQEKEIIGVMQDFHQESPRIDFEPQIFRLAERYDGYFSIKPVKGVNTKNLIKKLETEYQSFFPGNPFDYFFLEDFYNRQYNSEIRFGKVFGIFSVLALMITLLGILSLSAFTATQRSKEIGIRKVHGANIRQILRLLSANYVVLLFVAFILSGPVIYYALDHWLRNFASRMDIPWIIFILPVIIISLFSLSMVILQSMRAARQNPAEVLSDE